MLHLERSDRCVLLARKRLMLKLARRAGFRWFALGKGMQCALQLPVIQASRKL